MPEKSIYIKNKQECCGCNACVNICPKSCIGMVEDNSGFRYPKVDKKLCIECGRCKKVCPFLNETKQFKPIKSYAALNRNNDERLASSSGGIFIALAGKILSESGVVVGAVFDENWNVHHTCAEHIEEVLPMMGSKYIQSNTESTYKTVKEALIAGRKVLYTGTPCQISGLRHYLHKDYPGLYAVEIICHGVPSYKIWNSYLVESRQKQLSNETLKHLSFRDKSSGWRTYSVSMKYSGSNVSQMHSDNDYMNAFIYDWSLRPSCYNCKFKGGLSQADITLGDFWGIENTDIPDDNKGISCVICRTEKGQTFFESCVDISRTPVSYEQILKGNPSLEHSARLNDTSTRFHRLFPRKGFYKTKYRIEHPSIFYRAKIFSKRKLYSLFRILHIART
ncbi:MAG: Coenzyme F420 hydrogenase/dehydrogenase, beta subunit C-terminal domain [Muribaculaceae bacterium]|nr:Coenzyme F420 hydrogenase/dehydrogenase, beta subunit C-terminal domain [Muribaculaceae bacterium]